MLRPTDTPKGSVAYHSLHWARVRKLARCCSSAAFCSASLTYSFGSPRSRNRKSPFFTSPGGDTRAVGIFGLNWRDHGNFQGRHALLQPFRRAEPTLDVKIAGDVHDFVPGIFLKIERNGFRHRVVAQHLGRPGACIVGRRLRMDAGVPWLVSSARKRMNLSLYAPSPRCSVAAAHGRFWNRVASRNSGPFSRHATNQ